MESSSSKVKNGGEPLFCLQDYVPVVGMSRSKSSMARPKTGGATNVTYLYTISYIPATQKTKVSIYLRKQEPL